MAISEGIGAGRGLTEKRNAKIYGEGWDFCSCISASEVEIAEQYYS